MAETLKVIFLDVDGVLNWTGTEERFHGFIGIDPTRVERFNQIIAAHPDAKIVISSTWRKGMHGVYSGLDGITKVLYDHGIKGAIIGMTDMRFSRSERGSEIREWIQDFRAENPDVKLTYVILDDDDSGMKGRTFERYMGKNEVDEDQYETEVLEDLTPGYVQTFWDGEMRLGNYGAASLDIPGGLQDYHIAKAINILKGEQK